jgi:hypothetical protein
MICDSWGIAKLQAVLWLKLMVGQAISSCDVAAQRWQWPRLWLYSADHTIGAPKSHV